LKSEKKKLEKGKITPYKIDIFCEKTKERENKEIKKRNKRA